MSTRAYVQSLIERRRQSFPLASPQASVSQSLDAAQNELNELRSKIAGNDEELQMPDFKPNSQKTKNFWKRLEFGYNLQSQRSGSKLPSRTTVGFNLGYKLNDRSVIGLGIAYVAGLGNGWKHIRLTHEGVGVRSYADVKLKGSLWISGGFEMNHMQAFARLASVNDWQRSALMGVTKKLKLNAKKQSTIQILYDFNYKKNNTGPIQFRIGQIIK
jgi:hypothetical protein